MEADGWLVIQRDKFIIITIPILFLIIDLLISVSSSVGDPKMVKTLFLGIWMVSWWVFEILPLGITALIPLFYLPFSGVLDIKEVTPAYSNPVIFLFLGGFIIARGLEKTHLDERIALSILKKTGKTDTGIVVGFIIATAFLSMWISNTATTVMMVPIALSVTHFLKENLDEKTTLTLPKLTTVLFLSIAYAANIGGVMTPVGTPPNVVFIGYLSDLYGQEIDFYKWMLATVPVAVLLLCIMLFVLKRVFPFNVPLPKTFPHFIRDKFESLGPINASQKLTISVFLLAASLWIFKGAIHWALGINFLNDTSIAIFSALLLFLIPVPSQNFDPILDRKDIGKLPWDIVLLFGGGMALASALKDVGLIQMTTDYFGSLELQSRYMLIVFLSLIALFLTEIMSNVALCVVALPLIMKLGEAQGIDPILIAMPAAICTSFAFSMPISTPPNAIVFGTNAIRVSQMFRAGLILNLIAFALTLTLGFWLIQLIIL